MRKSTMSKLIEAPVKVKLWNGCYNVATCKVELSSTTYELRVEVTHPYLRWQCGDKDSVTLTKWVGCKGYYEEIPEGLNDKVAQMKNMATMSDEEAKEISRMNKIDFLNSMKELGISN